MEFELIQPVATSCRIFSVAALTLAAHLVCSATVVAATSSATVVPKTPAVVSLTIIRAAHAAEMVSKLYPRAVVRVDSSTNSLIILADEEAESAIRAILTALDIRSPQAEQSEVIPVTLGSADSISKRLQALFPLCRFSTSQKRMLIVTAPAVEFSQIRTIVSALDTPVPTPLAIPPLPATAFAVNQASPKLVARAIARALPRSQVSVSGSNIIVRGSAEDVQQVKPLLEDLDRPDENVPYVSVYKLSTVDATSVADLLSRSFPKLTFAVTKDINAISVSATLFEQTRIANAIAQLDAGQSATSAQASAAAFSSGQTDFEVLSLHSAIPATATNGSTTASDISQAVIQALGASAPDLKITVQPNSTRLILTGSARSRDMAKKLIADLDIAEPLVELDTRVLEVDEGAQTQLGLKFPTPVLASTYSEMTPDNALSATTPQLLRLQGLTRTPLSLEAQLDFLLSNNEAKILEDPRITTFSGRTATLRAGETVNILTTAGGGSGTVATTQIQSFQTGVTLDITPVVNADGYITVTLHPSVNSIAGIGTSGVPNIQTRDTTTTIGLRDGETLVIGGLIEDTDTKTTQKIPLLGDLPLVGRLFQDVGTSHARNELVVTVSPHILKPGDEGSVTHLSMRPDFPKISPDATLPPIKALPARDGPADPFVGRPTTTNFQTPAPRPSFDPSSIDLPTAFAQADTFVYGAAPSNSFAGDEQPPKIFFAKVQPTVVKSGTPITLSVLTTTNVSTLTLSTASSTHPAILSNLRPGRWEATFPFDASQLVNTPGNVTETLTATTKGGNATSIQIPFSISRSP